jgi:hypothetical protein
MDQILKGSVIVKKLKNTDNEYKIKFITFNDLLIYQTWSSSSSDNVSNINSNNNNNNNSRQVFLEKAKDWVSYNFTNDSIKFTPTTVMEVGNKKYIFVIEQATYNENKKYKLIFYISTKEIIGNNKINKLMSLPLNKKIKRARFDIDAAPMTYNNYGVYINISKSPYENIKPGTYVGSLITKKNPDSKPQLKLIYYSPTSQLQQQTIGLTFTLKVSNKIISNEIKNNCSSFNNNTEPFFYCFTYSDNYISYTMYWNRPLVNIQTV